MASKLLKSIAIGVIGGCIVTLTLFHITEPKAPKIFTYTDSETGCQYLTTDSGFIQIRLADNGYDVIGCKRMGDY